LKIKDFLKIYGAIVALQLATLFRESNDVLYFFSKPLILASLGVFAYSKLKEVDLKSKTFLLLALFFSFLGDIILMYKGQQMFLFGMGSFSLAHIGYLIFHRSHFVKFNLYKSIGAILFSLVLIGIVVSMVDIPSALKIPVYTYFLILMLHLILAALNSESTNLGLWPTIGVTVFMISDALIALSLFGSEPNKYLSMGVMLTYATAQALIVLGILKKRGLSD
jgi:uncharacterized membrane protein YhhN